MDNDFEATVLVAANSADRAALLKEALHGRFKVRLAASGQEALAAMQQAPCPHVAVIDTALEGPDAWTLAQEFKSNFLSAEIPLIFVADAASSARAWSEGAADLVPWPLDARALHARVTAHARLGRSQAMLKDQSTLVEALVAERTRGLVQMQDATIVAMAALAEIHEENIHNHIQRTRHMVAALAQKLRFHARFSAELTDENIGQLTKAVPLHDIGKVGVPDAILLKPSKLTSEEYNVMKQHTVYGHDAIAGVEQALGFSTPFLRYAREITHAHQERWDGSGYPQGLAGEQIPVSARLVAVADVYDALISRRRYRPAFTHETALELIRHGRGEDFDPDVVDAMLAIEEKILQIANEFRDPD
jgi:putative two-component system response regulator